MAEHGFSALVTVRRGDADRLGLDLSGVHAVVLSPRQKIQEE